MPGKRSEPELVLSRVFDAPRELVWEVWTKPEHIAKWWGPACWTCPVAEVDFREGGEFRWSMRSPEGQENWVVGVYHEIKRPEKIVSSMFFADENGEIVSAEQKYGMKGVPLQFRDINLFDVVEGNKTKLTLYRTEAKMMSERFGMLEGWQGSLDKFEKALLDLKKR